MKREGHIYNFWGLNFLASSQVSNVWRDSTYGMAFFCMADIEIYFVLDTYNLEINWRYAGYTFYQNRFVLSLNIVINRGGGAVG